MDGQRKRRDEVWAALIKNLVYAADKREMKGLQKYMEAHPEPGYSSNPSFRPQEVIEAEAVAEDKVDFLAAVKWALGEIEKEKAT